MTRVAIIGGGPNGLFQLAAFQELKNQGVEIPDITVFERQDQIGGLWNYNWRTGIDKDGYPAHNSMYRHLWTNAPKAAVSNKSIYFADFRIL